MPGAFNLTGKVQQVTKDGADGGIDQDIAVATGWTATLTSNYPKGVALPDGSNIDYVDVRTVTLLSDGSITEDGVTAGISLMAHDPDEFATPLQWTIKPGAVTLTSGVTLRPKSWTFNAPLDGEDATLGGLTPVAGIPLQPAPDSVPWDSVTGKPATLAAGPNVANGYAGLDGTGKIATAQLPISAMEYKGNWNASTNSPTLADGSGSAGDVYKVATGAARNLGSGSITWDVGDYVIYNGTVWEKDDTTDAVTSVAGLAGAITAANLKTALSMSLSVKDQGAVGNGTTNDRTAIAAADTAAISAGVAVQFPAGTYKVSSNLTIASPVVFQPGAIIKPDSGITVTLTGGVTASPSQRIFDHSASGLVVPTNVDFYHPGWWGAVNSSDDTAAWTAMVAALAAAGNSVIGIPFSYRVIVPKGTNTMIGVALTSCELIAGLGTSVFVPPSATTSGVVLTLGNYARLSGGSFTTTQPGQAVTCLYLQGYRAQADGIYAYNQAASSKAVQLGSTGQGSTSPILTNARLVSGNSTPAAGSVGLDVQSADVQVANVMAAQYDTGILNNGGSSGRWSNVHVWGNNTGIAGTAWDDCQVRNVYLDSNRGWGMDIDRMDRALWDGIYAWNNGNAIGSTGGIRLQQTTGSAQRSTLRGVVLDDNVGTGLHVNGTTDYEIDVVLCSASVQGGGSIVTTTGVNVASAATRLTLDLQGSDATTPLTDSSTTTQYGRWARNTHAAASKATPVDADEIPLVDSASGYGPRRLTIANLKTLAKIPAHVVASSNTVKNASTALAVFMSLTTQPGQAYLIRGAIVVAGNQAADMQFRLQNSGATSPSGWFAVATTLANSSTSGSAASVQDANNADILASGGNTVACGLVTGDRYVIQISGYLLAGTGSSQSLDCLVAQSVSDASNTTFYAGSWMELMPV